MVYISICLFFNRYISIALFLVFLYIIFSKKDSWVKRFLARKDNNDRIVYYHYREDFYLNIIYIFTRSVYVLVLVSFVIHGFVPFFMNNLAQIFYLALFAVFLDFIGTLYIVRYKNTTPDAKLTFLSFVPRAALLVGGGYLPYALQYPTHPASHPFHMYAPTFLGAKGVRTFTPSHVDTVDDIRTVYPYIKDLSLYTDPLAVPHRNITVFRIHTNEEMYNAWRTRLPKEKWSIYDLDKPFGSALHKREVVDCAFKSNCVGGVEYDNLIKKIEKFESFQDQLQHRMKMQETLTEIQKRRKG